MAYRRKVKRSWGRGDIEHARTIARLAAEYRAQADAQDAALAAVLAAGATNPGPQGNHPGDPAAGL
jgi:hypothetical protein